MNSILPKLSPSPVSYRIPFNRPAQIGREFEYIAQALANGQTSGDGAFTKRCQLLLQEQLGIERVLLTSSCTHALEMAAILLDLKPGDEVIVPSFTFVTTACAFALRGARIRFCDIRSDTLNLDERQLPQLITERTKAVIPVHYGGIGCEIESIQSTCAAHNITIIEDNAHGLFARRHGRYLGTIGQLGTVSFHETKNIQCGEGGALLINEAALEERAEIIREKGTNRNNCFRGLTDKYTWVDLGSSYLMSDLLAAFLLAQLEKREVVLATRAKIWHRYNQELAEWAKQNGVRTPHTPPDCEQPYHIYYLILPSLPARQALIEHLKVRNILAVFHYLPLNTSPMGRTFGANAGDCPVAEEISDKLLRLPLYFDMSDEEQSEVIRAVKEFRCG